MPVRVTLSLRPEASADESVIKASSCREAGINTSDLRGLRILRKSVDARGKKIMINLSVELLTKDDPEEPLIKPFVPQNVVNSQEVIIVGAGPAGLFAALRLIELGLRPVIIERGKDISERKRDLAKISREHKIDPDSNYCFGLGGAGTFSDGKLYTRSRKRGDNMRVLELLCLHGAEQNILYEAHPHIGSDNLPSIIRNIKNSILDAGGVLMLGKKVTDFIIESDTIKGILTEDNEKIYSPYVILATGHSARDIYSICARRRIGLEFKPFAMGVRVEHPQELIDRIQYHGYPRGKYLPSASYSLVAQAGGRGVYSFCMCPGGFIVPAATDQEEIVVNGMSPSQRNSKWANSGIVVEVRHDDVARFGRFGEMAGLEYQKYIERLAWVNGGCTQKAPAQRLADFVAGVSSDSLPEVSYMPGVTLSPLHEWLPESIATRLREGFRYFGSVMKGFLTNNAVITGVESRTSSPVRIPRDPETLSHPGITGLYPCGEGSGYAGGIVSSAIDGINAAEAISRKVNS